jgi:hypothetical protein
VSELSENTKALSIEDWDKRQVVVGDNGRTAWSSARVVSSTLAQDGVGVTGSASRRAILI